MTSLRIRSVCAASAQTGVALAGSALAMSCSDFSGGAVSDAVQSAAGFHVLKLTAQQPARTATLDEVRERLTQALRAQRQEQIAKAYLEGMLNTATLSIDGAELNKVLE